MDEISNGGFSIEIQDIEEMTQPKQKFNKKEYFKNYWIKNKDKLKQKYYDNHDEILRKRNEYQSRRKEERHEYYLKNKEKIMNQSKERYRKLKEALEAEENIA